MPLALVAKTNGTQRLMAVDAAATAAGLDLDMALAQARAMLPALQVLPHEPQADARLLEAIADWCDRYTPLVGRHPPDGLLLDITGAAHLQGGDAALRADLLQRLKHQGFTATAAIAPTPGAAWALARCRSDGVIVPPSAALSELDAILAPLPVAGLRLAAETVAALGRVGLKSIGDLIGRPRAALAARFGAPLIMRLDQARGIDSETISPRQPVPPAQVELGFAEPILTTDAVAEACRSLAEQLCALLMSRGQGATALQLAVYRVDGLVKRIDLRLASPSRDARVLAGLLALRLDHLDDPLDPGFGYDLIRFAATSVASVGPVARRLAGLAADLEPAELADARAALLDRLTARFGAGHVLTCAFTETHVPEHAARLVAVEQGTLDATRLSKPSIQRNLDGLSSAPTALRPLRLFDPPEPVEVMAEVPDGPPLRFRWRRRPLRVATAHGPERIAPEWWRPQALAEPSPRDLTRDYWRIEDTAGRRLWLYREGFYSASGSDPPVPPRWYVHGLFA